MRLRPAIAYHCWRRSPRAEGPTWVSAPPAEVVFHLRGGIHISVLVESPNHSEGAADCSRPSNSRKPGGDC